MLQLSLGFNLILVTCFVNRGETLLRSLLLRDAQVDIFLKQLKVSLIKWGRWDGSGSRFGVPTGHSFTGFSFSPNTNHGFRVCASKCQSQLQLALINKCLI